MCASLLLAGALPAQEEETPETGAEEPKAQEAAPAGADATAEDSPAGVSDPSAATAEEVGEPGFAESVDVTVVNVEVRVRDRDGNPVRGLTRDDFHLYEDDRPVTITNFYAVEDGYKRATALSSDRQAAEDDDEVAPAGERDPPLYLAIYVDNFNIRPFNRNRVFRRLREFLHTQLDEDDVTMLVSYDRTLNVQVPFTSDRNRLLAKLDELERFTGHAVSADADRRQVMREIDEASSESFAKMAADTYAQSTFSDLRFSIRALHDFVEQLAGVGGRRAILHVSDGMPMRAAESVFYALERKYSTSAINLTALDYDATREFRSLAAAAAANGVTFYTLDAAGLRSPTGAGVQSMTAAGSSAMVDSVYIRNHQQPLRFLAEETGGFAIVNTNDVGPALTRVRQDLDEYYSLGYSPAGTVSGRGHRLKVEIPGRRKLEIRYRQSYREQTVAEQMEDETLAALRFGLQENPFGARLQPADMRPVDNGLFDVTAWLQIPVEALTLVPGPETHRGRLTLYVSALDQEGGLSDVAQLDVPIELPNEEMSELRQMDFPYRLALRMRPGPHRLAVGIRDELGGRSSYLSREIMVGAVQ